MTTSRNPRSFVYLTVLVLASLIWEIGPKLRVISGVPFVVAIIFVILKLVGVLDWSWLWVLAPVWIMAAYFPLMIVSGFIIRHDRSRFPQNYDL